MATRQMGEILQVSIATACALEAILKIQTPVHETALWINLMTLYRNLRGAYSKEEVPTNRELFIAIEEEMKAISALADASLPGKLVVNYYLPSYETAQRRLIRYAKFKTPSTEKQKAEYQQMVEVMNWLMQQKIFDEVHCTDSHINGNNERAFIITHYPIDLLSYPSFRELTLVESHTGTFKKKTQWNTKLTNHEKYSNMPFNILTLQVIGDNSTMFKSMGPAFVGLLTDLASKGHYTSGTTPAKIAFDLDRHPDKLSADILKLMLNLKLT